MAGTDQLIGGTQLVETRSQPLVTLAVFAFNQEMFIRRAVNAAFQQTYSPLEIILSDDCSSDQTFEILQELARAYDGPHQVRVRRQVTNQGLLTHVCDVAADMNGDIMVLAAGDDISDADRVAEIVRCWRPDTLGMLSSCELIDEDENMIQENWMPAEDARTRLNWLKSFKTDVFVYGASSAYKRSLLTKLPRSRGKVFSEDTPLNLLLQLETGSVVKSEKPLVRYRVHGGSISSTQLTARPSFRNILDQEKARPRQIAVQHDILDYLMNELVPSAQCEDMVDLGKMTEDISFCSFRLSWHSNALPKRILSLVSADARRLRWAIPRIFGPEFYAWIRFLVLRLGFLGKRHSGPKG